jgi:DnaJ-domain-containing protein 1
VTRWIILLVLLFVVIRIVRSLLVPRSHVGRTRPVDRAASDPHAVLGVPPGASGEQIAEAYRERMKEYHPDRVASLGPELRELAHRKTVEIQRARDALRRK